MRCRQGGVKKLLRTYRIDEFVGTVHLGRQPYGDGSNTAQLPIFSAFRDGKVDERQETAGETLESCNRLSREGVVTTSEDLEPFETC